MKARLPQGMGGGPGNMQAMLRQAQKMQEQMAVLQEDLDNRTYTATVGGGAVSATVNGKHTVQSLTISPAVVDPDDVDMLTDLVTAAINEAIRQAIATSEQEMGALTGGMGVPGLR